jgi:hypothetical protein
MNPNAGALRVKHLVACAAWLEQSNRYFGRYQDDHLDVNASAAPAVSLLALTPPNWKALVARSGLERVYPDDLADFSITDAAFDPDPWVDTRLPSLYAEPVDLQVALEVAGGSDDDVCISHERTLQLVGQLQEIPIDALGIAERERPPELFCQLGSLRLRKGFGGKVETREVLGLEDVRVYQDDWAQAEISQFFSERAADSTDSNNERRAPHALLTCVNALLRKVAQSP